MNIWYMTKDGNFYNTDNTALLKIEEFIQSLQIWQGEQSFNATNGIDWLNVLNEQLDPEMAIRELAQNSYNNYFYISEITVNRNKGSKILEIGIMLTLMDGQKINREVII